MQSIDLPTEQCTSTGKVMEFLESCDVNTPCESLAVSNSGESSHGESLQTSRLVFSLVYRKTWWPITL